MDPSRSEPSAPHPLGTLGPVEPCQETAGGAGRWGLLTAP